MSDDGRKKKWQQRFSILVNKHSWEDDKDGRKKLTALPSYRQNKMPDKLHKTKGIVLGTVKYGETSIIVTIFTELFGL